MESFRNVWKKFFWHVIAIELIIILWVVLIGWVIFHFVEWLSFFHAVYFAVTTMATVWFGDIVPKTDLGRVFVMIYAFMGVPLFLSISWLILESRFNRRIKSYVAKFHKELHKAEEELKEVEEKVNKELWDAIEKTDENVSETKWEVKETKQNVLDTKEEVMETKKEVKETKKKVEKIENTIDENPRWKKVFKN